MHHAFQQLKQKRIKSHKLEFIEFEHKKTSAQIIWLKNKDKDATFAIEFFTPPQDDTGVEHILEHSILMGSEKYHAQNQDLFATLISRKSMTFINALTYPERTQYPISTINKKDYFDVMRVYLDSVFAPLLLRDINIFRQEGWRIEENQGKLAYNGTVLNEMRSSLSNPHGRILRALLRHSFADSSYKYESGGDPNNIVDLSYENAVKYYKKHYHPSNSKTFLYGDLDINKALALLDEYFSRYSKGSKPRFKIKKHKTKHKVNISLHGNPQKDSYLAMSFYGEKASKLKENLILSIIWISLLTKESDVLKAALRATEKVSNIQYEFEDYIAINTANLVLANVDAKDLDFLEKTVLQTLTKVSKTGLDRKRIKTILDRLELDLAKIPYAPKRGINYLEAISKMWRFSDNDTYFKIENIVNEISAEFSKNPALFDKYFEKYFIQAENYTVIKAKASSRVKYFNELYKKERTLNKLSAKQKAKIKKEIDDFNSWQEARQHATDTRLPIDPSRPKDFPKSLKRYKLRKYKTSGTPVYYRKISNTKINQMHLYFDLSYLSLKDLQRAAVLLPAFKKLRAKNLTRRELDNLESSYLGSINFTVAVTQARNSEAKRAAVLDLDYLSRHSKYIPQILNGYLKDLEIDPAELKGQLKEILNDISVQIRGIMAYKFAKLHASQSFSEFDFVSEELSGISFVEFIKDELKLSDDELRRHYSRLYKHLFYADKLSVAVAANNKDNTQSIIKALNLRQCEAPAKRFRPKNKVLNTALKVSGLDGNFNAEVFSAGKFYPGAYILAPILRLKDLWKKIREEGGAYGAFFASRIPDGLSVFVSYNDPHVTRSFNVYANIFSELEFDKDDFDGAKSNALLDNFFMPKSELHSAYDKLVQDKNGFTDGFYDSLLRNLHKTTQADIHKIAKQMHKKQMEANVKVSIVKDFPEDGDKMFDRMRNLDF